jgi:hypothetical protein
VRLDADKIIAKERPNIAWKGGNGASQRREVYPVQTVHLNIAWLSSDSNPSSTVLKIKLLTLNDLRNVKSLLALHFWPGPHYWSSRNVGGSATPVARTACEASAVS